MGVLGQDKVVQLAVLDKILNGAIKNPYIVINTTYSCHTGPGSSLEGAAAILSASNLVKAMPTIEATKGKKKKNR